MTCIRSSYPLFCFWCKCISLWKQIYEFRVSKHGRPVCTSPALYSAHRPAILTEAFCGGPRALSCTCYIHYSRGSVLGWGTMLQAGRSACSIPDEVIGFFNLPNPSSRTMALGSTQPLTEMSARKLPEAKGRPARGADYFTAICKPIV
jgi:hypothetical protein